MFTLQNPSDFKEIITKIENIIIQYHSYETDSKTFVNLLMHVSEPIINCKYIDNEALGNYSKICLSVSDRVNNGEKITQENIDRWGMYSKIVLSLAFTNLSLKMRDEGTYYNDNDPELYETLANYFDVKTEPVIFAFYHAIRRFSYTRPKFCYEKTLEAFKAGPTFFKDMYSDCNYVFSDFAKDKIYRTCTICGSSESDPYYCAEQSALYEKDDSCRLYSPAKLWMKCRKCSNLYAYNFPAYSFEEIYNSTQEQDTKEVYVVSKPHSYESRIPKFHFFMLSDILNNIMAFNTGKRYIEVGLGNGEMLSVALEMGYDVTAIEINRETCEKLSADFDIDIYLCDFLKFNIQKKFDVMIMGDVIEHVSNPTEALSKAYDLLDKGGILWLSTPNYEGSFGKYKKFFDPMWNEKQHFTYFSYRGFKPICQNIGFEIKRYDVSRRYNGSMELILQKV